MVFMVYMHQIITQLTFIQMTAHMELGELQEQEMDGRG
jgi:hypothetical protein